jgi:hypothetical protein
MEIFGIHREGHEKIKGFHRLLFEVETGDVSGIVH